MELVNPEKFWHIYNPGDRYWYGDIFNNGNLDINFLFNDGDNEITHIYSANYMAYIFKNQIEERRKYFGTS